MNNNLMAIIDNLVVNKQLLAYATTTERTLEDKVFINSINAESVPVIGVALCSKNSICSTQHILALTEEKNNTYNIHVLTDDPFYMQLMNLTGIPVPTGRIGKQQISDVLNNMGKLKMTGIDAVNYFNIYASYLNWKPFTAIDLMSIDFVGNTKSQLVTELTK